MLGFRSGVVVRVVRVVRVVVVEGGMVTDRVILVHVANLHRGLVGYPVSFLLSKGLHHGEPKVRKVSSFSGVLPRQIL